MTRTRVAVVGAGTFGRHHVRVLNELPDAELAAVVDPDLERAARAAANTGARVLADAAELRGTVDAAVVAAPTSAHAQVAGLLLESGIDVLVEKPIADGLPAARGMAAAAGRHGRILQVGHLERFNPAIIALQQIASIPLFFEIHRMSVFSPRSLDVDVVLDLMIHDLDIVLKLAGKMPEEVRASGLSILSDKVDIANVRLAFPGGCIANLTASRVSTERIRKLRLFQPHQYVSLDYQKQQAVAFTVSSNRQIEFLPLRIKPAEPLKLELASFLECVRTRQTPVVTAGDGIRALEVALGILDKIEEHLAIVRACTPAV